MQSRKLDTGVLTTFCDSPQAKIPPKAREKNRSHRPYAEDHDTFEKGNGWRGEVQRRSLRHETAEPSNNNIARASSFFELPHSPRAVNHHFMLPPFLQALVAAFLGLFHHAAPVTSAACREFFLNGTPPFVATQTQILCNHGYAVGLDAHGSPLWSAEHLTEEQLDDAQAHPGRSDFEADPRVAFWRRADLSDFRGSGWSRGHLTPSADEPYGVMRDETYLLSNVVPQDGHLNSGKWDQLERSVREQAIRDGEIYVVTGPVYADGGETIGVHDVRVPVALWKAVYDPADRTAVMTLCGNNRQAVCQRVGGIDGVRVFTQR